MALPPDDCQKTHLLYGLRREPVFSILTSLSPMHQSISLPITSMWGHARASIVNLRGDEHVTAAHCSPSIGRAKVHIVTPLTRKRHRSYVLSYAKRQPVAPFSTRAPVAGAGAAVSATGALRRRRCEPRRPLARPAPPPSADVWHGLCSTSSEQSAGTAIRAPRSWLRGPEAASRRRRRDLSAAGAVGPLLAHLASAVATRPRRCAAPYAGSGMERPGIPASW